jgi:hypothetical protein
VAGPGASSVIWKTFVLATALAGGAVSSAIASSPSSASSLSSSSSSSSCCWRAVNAVELRLVSSQSA